MKIAIASLKSESPYEQSKFIKVDKLDKESAGDFEKRVWRERIHRNAEGFVIIPPMAFKNCLSEAAKYLSLQIPGKGKSTYTKHFEAGILVTEPLVLPIKWTDVEGVWLFLNADGKRGSGKRVEKCMPVIPAWEGNVTFYILDETITKDVFLHVLEESGRFIGIGTFRPRNNGFFGRFSVQHLDWK